MTPLAAAILGGAAVAAGTYSYQKLKASRESKRHRAQQGNDPEAEPLIEDVKGLFEDVAHAASSVYASRRQRLTIVIGKAAATAGEVREEVEFIGLAVFEEAQAVLHNINEEEIKPLRNTVRKELHALGEAISEEDGLVADSVLLARDLFSVAMTSVAETGKKAMAAAGAHAGKRNGNGNGNGHANGNGAKRSIPLSPKAVWRSLKQAKDLIFDDIRERQFDEMSEPADGTAHSQIVKTEQIVNRYLRVAATSAAFATAGALFFPPLKIVSAGMILYAAFPVFKGAYIDIVQHRRITVKILDSISFIGLLAGGYFLICSLTATIFHSSTKMMLKTEDRSRQILANMFGQQPRTVLILMNGEEIEIPFAELTKGNTLVVHAGQMIPVDGVVASGTASIDQHILTGEAQPAEKSSGDLVFAATMMLAGRIEVRVEKTGAETAAAQIREVLANTTDFRTAIQARWRGVADKTVLPTLGLAGVAMAVLNPASALAVVNSNYVAVMKVASPLGMLNFLQRASQAGVLIKDGRALEAAGKVDTVVFDKTGTLTETQPHVGEIHCFDGFTADELLTCAASVESNQSHPIGQAIVRAASRRGLALPPLEDERYEVGYGIEARIGGRTVRVGSARYMSMLGIALPGNFEAKRQAIQERGASIVYVAFGDQLAGAIELNPTLRPEAKEVVAKLKALGLTLYIISGDHSSPTQALAAELGIENYFAEVLPQDKSAKVESLQKEGRHVCFIGDGINDAIALKKADVSVSLRGASSLATNTAQIILMDESLKQLPQVFEVANDYDANLRTLMTTTFLPGLVSLAGVFLLGTGNATALLLFNLSMIAGLLNAIWPALQNLPETSVAAGTESEPAVLIKPDQAGSDAFVSDLDPKLFEKMPN